MNKQEVPSLPHASGGNGRYLPCFSQDHRLLYHARRARGKHARDGTKYGKSRASATNFYYTHHAQRISMAAAIGEAAGIHKAVRIMKQARCASERAARAGAAY